MSVVVVDVDLAKNISKVPAVGRHRGVFRAFRKRSKS